MTVEEMIAELRKHPSDMPVVIATDDIYDDDITITFNPTVGIEIRGNAVSQLIDELENGVRMS